MTCAYWNLRNPLIVDGDALVAVRPHPASGAAFMAALRDALAERGIDRDWVLFAISAAGRATFIWMRSMFADDCDGEDFMLPTRRFG